MLSPTYIPIDSPKEIEDFQHTVDALRGDLYVYENIMYAQILTHQILEILKPSIFTEFKYCGSKYSAEYAPLQKLKLFDYFDVKNETLDYSGFDLSDDLSPQISYYQRFMGENKYDYECLIKISKIFIRFPAAAENYRSEYQYLLMKAGSIQLEEEAILKSILPEPQFQMWQSLREKHMISIGVAPQPVKETNSEISLTTATSRLKI